MVDRAKPSARDKHERPPFASGKIDGEKITDKKFLITEETFKDGKVLVEKGKKKKILVELK